MIVSGDRVEVIIDNNGNSEAHQVAEKEEPDVKCHSDNDQYSNNNDQSATTCCSTEEGESATFDNSAGSEYSQLDGVAPSSEALDWSNVVGRLYDREKQMKVIQEAYLRRRKSRDTDCPELCLITGFSGTGKSRLAHSLREVVEKDGGFFICGKFDQLRQPSVPFATLAGAIQGLVQLIQKRDDTEVQAIREDIQSAVGSEALLLAETFPCLRDILDVKEPRKPSSESNIAEQKHIATVFRRFIQAIASPKRPLVFFLDDLQWADIGSLDLLKTIWQSSSAEGQEQRSIPGLLSLGTARGNEVAFDSYLSKILRNMEDSGAGLITEVQVGNLSKKAIGEMLSDLLGVSREECISLTEVVFHRSNQGHVFHAMRYVESLQEDGYLIQDDRSGTWCWNEKKITEKSKESSDHLTSDSLTILLEQKTKQMPKKTREILKVASCLGGEFSAFVLCKAANMPLREGMDALNVGCKLGFVTLKSKTGVGRFMHDKFQEAAYALIPQSEKPAFHLQVGKNLGANLTEEEFDENLLLIVNLGIFGSEGIDAEECRQKLAELCFSAGRRAAKSSAFSAAVHYFETGAKMLANNHWQDQYTLSLELHTAAAEMAYCMGDHRKVDFFADTIYENAKCLSDQLPAKSTQIMSWFSIERYEDAAQLGFKVARDLGEKFPRKVGTAGIIMDFMKTKRVLSGKSDLDILRLPPMTDMRVTAVMSIIHLLYGLLMRSQFEMAPLIGFRMVRLTMKHGLSPISSFGFGAYASIHSRMGMIEDSVRYGHLALQILERYPSSVASRTLCTVWGDSMPHKIAFRKCIEPIEESHRLGMSSGDIETAGIAGFVHAAIMFYIGEPLSTVEKAVSRYSVVSSEYQNSMVKDFFDVLRQGCSNLQGQAAGGNPLILTGKFMQEDEMIKKASQEKLATGFLWIFVIKYMLAAYMHDFEYAASLSYRINKHMKVSVIPLIQTVHIFLEGFVAAAGGTSSRRKRSIARSKLKELRRAAKNCPENLSNKVCILEAEIARFSHKHEKALQKYDEAVKLAAEDNCLHEQGLASERAGRLLIEVGSLKKGQEYLKSARNFYAQWGGKVKVEQMDRMLYTKSLE